MKRRLAFAAAQELIEDSCLVNAHAPDGKTETIRKDVHVLAQTGSGPSSPRWTHPPREADPRIDRLGRLPPSALA